MTNDILNWSLKPALYALITLDTAFCSILMIINTENSIRGKDTEYRHISYEANLLVPQSTAEISQQLLKTNQYQQDFSIQDRAAEIKIDASQLSYGTKSYTSEGSYSGPIRLVVIFEFLFFYYEYNEI